MPKVRRHAGRITRFACLVFAPDEETRRTPSDRHWGAELNAFRAALLAHPAAEFASLRASMGTTAPGGTDRSLVGHLG